MKWNEMLVTQLCPTLLDPMDCSPSGSWVHGILQASILEWVAISFSNEVTIICQVRFCLYKGARFSK